MLLIQKTLLAQKVFVAMNDVGLTILLLNILACYSFQKREMYFILSH